MTVGAARKLTVRIILEDGTPEGVRKVSVSSWNGAAVVCSRAQYPAVKGLKEFARPGVYVLVGESEAGPHVSRIYVGEADDLQERMESHYRDRDWWTRLIAFSSSDDFFNKAHVQFVESRLIELARLARRAELENQNQPRPPRISEADIADSERFLDYMLLLLPILGVFAFEAPAAEPRLSPVATATVTDFFVAQRGAIAQGRPTRDGFLVLKGARGRATMRAGARPWILAMREDLLRQGVLAVEGEDIVLRQDYVFTSPSTAVAVFFGSHASGPREWKTKDGDMLIEVEQKAVQQ